MDQLKPSHSSSISLPPDSYIYSLIPTADALAAISSDDSLRVIDLETLVLRGQPQLNLHDGITCLKSFDVVGNVLATAGREGSVRVTDIRSGTRVMEFKGNSGPILSLDCCPIANAMAAGTELMHSQANVMLWDIRSPNEPRIKYTESHNDDVTDIRFHPTRSAILLSGSTDGLINIYDTTITDEEDALYQVINHGSSIHYAGFLNEKDIFGLSHDETLSIYQIATPDEKVEEPAPLVFGDLRPKFNCEYVVDLLVTGTGEALLAAGNHSEKRLDIISLTPNPQWDFTAGGGARLQGAHGEEIVRSLVIDKKTQKVYTAGEDGHIRSWVPSEAPTEEAGVSSLAKVKRKKETRSVDARFKPY